MKRAAYVGARVKMEPKQEVDENHNVHHHGHPRHYYGVHKNKKKPRKQRVHRAQQPRQTLDGALQELQDFVNDQYFDGDQEARDDFQRLRDQAQNRTVRNRYYTSLFQVDLGCQINFFLQEQASYDWDSDQVGGW